MRYRTIRSANEGGTGGQSLNKGVESQNMYATLLYVSRISRQPLKNQTSSSGATTSEDFMYWPLPTSRGDDVVCLLHIIYPHHALTVDVCVNRKSAYALWPLCRPARTNWPISRFLSPSRLPWPGWFDVGVKAPSAAFSGQTGYSFVQPIL